MKRSVKTMRYLSIYLSAVIVISACELANSKTGDDVKATSGNDLTDNPVTITKDDNEQNIVSFAAEIKEYEEHSRIPDSRRLVSKYRLSQKLIEDEIYTRVDFPTEEGFSRSVIATTEEIVTFDRDSSEVLSRIPNPYPKAVGDLKLKSLFNRTSTEKAKEQYSRLSYRITEIPDSNFLIASTPQEKLSFFSEDGISMIYREIYFDMDLGVPAGCEYQTVDEEGVTITVKEHEVFQEIDGVPVRVGEVRETHYDYPYELDTSDRLIPDIESPNEIIEMTEEEFNSLIEETGAVPIVEDAIIGDMGDLDHTITTTTIYEDVSLNSLDDSYFRPHL